MDLHEVKIGDMVTFTTKKGKKVKGKVIHRHNDAAKAHLMGHVNVQVDDEGAYPQTVHVSKLKKITEETIMDSEYISEEEFEALSPEEQANYEMVQLDEVGPDGRRNRALRSKIGSTDPLRPFFQGKVGDGPRRRDDSLTRQRASNKDKNRDELATSPRPRGKPGSSQHTHELKNIIKRRNRYDDGSKNTQKTGPNPNFQKMNATANKLRKEEMENTIPHFLQAVLSGENTEAYNILDELMSEKIDAALSALKVDVAQNMFANEAVIAPRATPSPDATAAAKADIEKARKKREDALAAAKAELASTSKGELKKALYSKLYKKEEVESLEQVIEGKTKEENKLQKQDVMHDAGAKTRKPGEFGADLVRKGRELAKAGKMKSKIANSNREYFFKKTNNVQKN